MQIQISWLLISQFDLDLLCLQRQGIFRLSRTRVNIILMSLPYLNTFIPDKVQGGFTYLGSTLSRVVHIDDEVDAKASAAFGQLCGSVWD